MGGSFARVSHLHRWLIHTVWASVGLCHFLHTPSHTCLHPGVCVCVIRSHRSLPDILACLCMQRWPRLVLAGLSRGFQPASLPAGLFLKGNFSASFKVFWTSLLHPTLLPHSVSRVYLIFSQFLAELTPPCEVSVGKAVKSS